MGDRLQQTVGVTQTRYTLDLNAGLTQVLSDGTNAYLYGQGRIAQYQTAMHAFSSFGADALGSVRQMYSANGQVVANARYDPYGNVVAQTGAASAYGFTGEQQDATGLVYLRARYYASAQGRFVTRDEWEGDYNAPLTLNKWNYVESNPINLTDPSGHDPWWCDFQADPKLCRASYLWSASANPAKKATDYVSDSCLQSTWSKIELLRSRVCKGKVGEELDKCERESQNNYNATILNEVGRIFPRTSLGEIIHISQFVKRIIAVEGYFDPKAQPTGSTAVGLMQIQDAAAKDVLDNFGKTYFPNGLDRTKPEENIRAGVLYLQWNKESLQRQDNDRGWVTPHDELWKFAIAAYNAGVQNIRQYRYDAFAKTMTRAKPQGDPIVPTIWDNIKGDNRIPDGARRDVAAAFSAWSENPAAVPYR